jgi:hypothetical protein
MIACRFLTDVTVHYSIIAQYTALHHTLYYKLYSVTELTFVLIFTHSIALSHTVAPCHVYFDTHQNGCDCYRHLSMAVSLMKTAVTLMLH